jgi:hypothetical protein
MTNEELGSETFYCENRENLLHLALVSGQLSVNLNNYHNNTVLMADAYVGLADDLKVFYARDGDANRADVMEKVVKRNKELRDVKLGEMKSYMTTNIEEPLRTYTHRLHEVKECITKRDEKRHRLDHYKNKLRQLKADKTEKDSRGKTVSKKELDRIERNEIKLSNAEIDFEIENRNAGLIMRDVWELRHEILNPLTDHVLVLHRMLASALVESLTDEKYEWDEGEDLHATAAKEAAEVAKDTVEKPREITKTTDNQSREVKSTVTPAMLVNKEFGQNEMGSNQEHNASPFDAERSAPNHDYAPIDAAERSNNNAAPMDAEKSGAPYEGNPFRIEDYDTYKQQRKQQDNNPVFAMPPQPTRNTRVHFE